MRIAAILVILALVAIALYWRSLPGKSLTSQEFSDLFLDPLPAPEGPVNIFHLGHSLVGRDIPAMLAQLGGHRWNSQLGWGASLKDHWSGEVKGFAEENATPAFRAAGEALDSGDYRVVVLTEMVELRDAIRWHASAEYLAKWTARAKAGNPGVRVYLYETWHRLDDPAGWEARVAQDLTGLWEAGVLRPAAAEAGVIYLIPGGQVMAALIAEAEAGRLGGIASRRDFFTDDIHLSDLGAYAMALTHYAVIYGRSPEGLPAALQRADGSPADAPTPATATAMQRVVWDVVRKYRQTGLPVE